MKLPPAPDPHIRFRVLPKAVNFEKPFEEKSMGKQVLLDVLLTDFNQ